MPESVLSALITGLCTAIASIIGCRIQNQKSVAVINVKLEDLEKALAKLENKVGVHNGFEGRLIRQEEKMAVANHRIDDLEQKAA